MAHTYSDDSDEALLARALSDECSFAEFYRRWERPMAAFFMRAVGSAEVAADLTAEAFAEALSSVSRFDPARGQAAAWLFGIARHLLARSRERGRVENQARVRLGLPPLALDDELIARIEAAGGEERALRLLARLPEDQRQALPSQAAHGAAQRAADGDHGCSWPSPVQWRSPLRLPPSFWSATVALGRQLAWELTAQRPVQLRGEQGPARSGTPRADCARHRRRAALDAGD